MERASSLPGCLGSREARCSGATLPRAPALGGLTPGLQDLREDCPEPQGQTQTHLSRVPDDTQNSSPACQPPCPCLWAATIGARDAPQPALPGPGPLVCDMGYKPRGQILLAQPGVASIVAAGWAQHRGPPPPAKVCFPAVFPPHTGCSRPVGSEVRAERREVPQSIGQERRNRGSWTEPEGTQRGWPSWCPGEHAGILGGCWGCPHQGQAGVVCTGTRHLLSCSPGLPLGSGLGRGEYAGGPGRAQNTLGSRAGGGSSGARSTRLGSLGGHEEGCSWSREPTRDTPW